MNGSADKTVGGLGKNDLKKNRQGRIVSKAKSSPMKGKLKKDEFYCLRCRSKTKASKGVKEVSVRIPKYRASRNMAKANCAKCDSKVCKLVKK